MADTYLTRTPSSAGNRKTWTVSVWCKFSGATGEMPILNAWSSDANSGHFVFKRRSTNQNLGWSQWALDNFTNSSYRDVHGWYHIVLAVDTTQSTASDRAKLYVNGEQVTSFAASYNLGLNEDTEINNSSIHHIGVQKWSSLGSNYYNGSMAHYHLCDGTAYAPTAFGETDSTTGIWKPKTAPSVNYGTNGFFLKFENSASMGTDSSGNGNNWSVTGGTMTQLIDTPSNVFCTLNPLNGNQPTGGIASVLRYGNTEFRDGENGSNYSYVAGTLGANSGKWYWETKVTDLAEIDQVGVVLADTNFSKIANSTGLQGTAYGGKGFQFSNGYKVGDGTGGTYMGAFSANDIAMIALDLDNNKITFGRNGQWSNGSGSCNQTYANSTAAYTNLTSGKYYVPAQAKRAYGSNYGTNNYNFGNGYFGTTAITSEGTNASGIGKFEYDVPTGFTALSTKGLNE